MKKLISLFLALVMVFSLAVPALAAEDTITLYFDNTEGWSEVYAYVGNDESSDVWPGTAMTLVEGETSIYSVEVSTEAAYVIFNNYDSQTADQTLPTDGTNLFTITGWSSGYLKGEWSVYVSNRKGDVTANFNPYIAITDISFTGNTVTYDETTNTYTFVIPVGEEAVEGVGVTYGTNLNYIPADDETYLVKIYTYEGGELLNETELPFGMFVNDESGYYIYDEATGTLTQQCEASTDAAGYTLGVSFSNDGGLSWSDLVYYVVKQAYTISVADNIAGGSVYVGADYKKTSAVEGEIVELFVHAEEGYELQSLTVTYEDENNEKQPVDVAEDHTFVMPAAAVTVNATFTEATTAYTITVDDTIDGGFVTVNDNLTSAHEGDDIILTVTPKVGYELVAVTVNDGSGSVTVHQVQGETNQYTFTMPAADVTVTATFKAVYRISIDKVGNGTVTADKYTAAEGETVTLTITPDEGYVLYKLFNDAGFEFEVTGNTCTFVMPAEVVYITAEFVRAGKALETLYFKNTGNWSTINVLFYTDSGSYGLGSANLTIVGSETDIYHTTAIPEFAYKVKFVYDGVFSEFIDLPTDGILNQYNPDDGTWTEFVATEQAPISADIVWGSMAFTYTDEGGWANNSTAEDAGTVTVTNTGDTDFTAAVAYTALDSYSEITGSFDEDSADLVADDSQTFTLTLEGEPKKAIPAGTKIGEVTVTIK